MIPDAQIVQVISNKKDAYGLKRAENAGIPTYLHSLYNFKKDHPELDLKVARESYDEQLAQIILRSKPEIVVCAGWMLILSQKFLEPMRMAGIPIINLHPALPGRVPQRCTSKRH